MLKRGFRLYVGILTGDILDAGTRLQGVQVVMSYDHGTGVTPVEVFEESSHRSLLFRRSCIGGLTSDVEPTLVADADRVAVVVHAVGTDHPFRSSWLDLSVTTDDVVVPDAEVESPLAVPTVDLSRRTHLVRPHRGTVNNNQRYSSHNPVQLIVASAVAMDVAIVATHLRIEITTFFLFIIVGVIIYKLSTFNSQLSTQFTLLLG